MDSSDIVAGFVVALLVALAVFVGCLLGAALGALAGWIVGFTVLGTWILGFMASAGIHTNMVEFGCFCGFMGGFFKTSLSTKTN